MRRNSSRKKLKLVFFTVIVFFFIAVFFFFKQIQNEYDSITTFQECVDSGHEIIPTYPEQCKIPGKIFTNSFQIASTDVVSTTTNEEKNMNPKNTSYDVDGQIVALQNGLATVIDETLGLSSKKLVKYFGNELRVDVDGDNKEDTAFILSVNTSGTGIFYYLVVALNKDGGYVGINGVFIGDRIAPQTTEWRNGEIVVNYADRKIEEPMSVKPSVGISRYFKVTNDALVEIQK